MQETDYTTIKELWELAGGESVISYNAFQEKFKRLVEGNVRTTNRILRGMGHTVTRERPIVQPTFVAYDGEGWDDKFVLLGNSLGERVVNKDGLSTVECLELLSANYDQVIKRVFFSFSYDVNHILRDVPETDLLTLTLGRSISYQGYRISYIPGKIFTVNGYKYYDVFSFFARSFVRVVELMLGKDRVTAELLAGKAARGSFETWDIEKIIRYNDEELKLLVEICERLDVAFKDIGVNLTQWYGPGAVAKYWLKEHDVRIREKHTTGSIEAVNGAYYGGRFEQLSLGTFRSVYEYDIHSAYPSVIATMPYFTRFRPVRKFTDYPYAVWYISFDLRGGYPLNPTFFPLPVRSKEGHISFPMVGKGWYWYEEIKVMLDFFPEAKVKFHKGYAADVEGYPFIWVAELYAYRQSLKDTGNLAQYAIKVGLNSLYGKTAQRVGRNDYFSLAWAGYITSTTRAKLARAGYDSPKSDGIRGSNVIGFATDAIFTTVPLKLRLTDQLGDWEQSHYDSATFFQSGIYRLVNASGNVDDRYRGSPLRKGVDDIVRQLKEHPYSYPKVRIVRFISNLLAIRAPKAYGPLRLKFVAVQQQLQLDAPYKRHYLFPNGNFGSLLTRPIPSDPKVSVNDNLTEYTSLLLHGELPLGNVESNPPPMKDANSMRLLEEAERLAVEEGYTEALSELVDLPVVEDEME